jgi:effector-binding domain-containing protein
MGTIILILIIIFAGDIYSLLKLVRLQEFANSCLGIFVISAFLMTSLYFISTSSITQKFTKIIDNIEKNSYKVTTENAQTYSEPKKNSKKLQKLSKGEIIKVFEPKKFKSYYEFTLENQNDTLYILKENVSKLQND